jgi:hypothetical protein
VRSSAVKGVIERRWALDRALDRNNREAPKLYLICIIKCWFELIARVCFNLDGLVFYLYRMCFHLHGGLI